MKCVFCNPMERVIAHGEHAFIVEDGYPVVDGHLLIIPWEHFQDYENVIAYPEVKKGMLEMVDEAIHILDTTQKPDGFNVGWNIGKAAGQTVFHCHMHVIPRWLDGPRNKKGSYGGIRYAVPGKGDYDKSDKNA